MAKRNHLLLTLVLVTVIAEISLLSTPSFPQPPGENMSYSALKLLIESKNLTSVEEVLPHLPETFRSRYALMYTSGSTQPASFVQPRVLLYNPDAGFILAFNDIPNSEGKRKLEIIQFNYDLNAFEFYSIQFDPDPTSPGKAVFFSEKNPFLCSTCHYDDSRPNWDPFPITVGAYGSSDDQIMRGSREDKGYRAFVGSRNKGPYRFISPLDTVENGDGTAYRFTAFPNRRFGAALNELNFRRIKRKLCNNPEIKHFRYAIQASLTEDLDADIETFIPLSLFGSLPAAFMQIKSQSMARRRENAKSLRQACSRFAGMKEEEVADLMPYLERDDQKVSSLRYVVEVAMQESMNDWAMTRDADSLIFTSADQGVERLGELLLKDLLDDHPSLDTCDKEAFHFELRKLSFEKLKEYERPRDRQGQPALTPQPGQ
jgi:hypothetical protein